MLTVPAKHFKEGIFSAAGGALWFEAERPSAGGGLIEGATPECRTPKQLLAYQRAQDRLLTECAANANLVGRLRLIKNDRDAFGNIYGAQENYQATLATGIDLFGWRAGLLVLFPLAVLTWIGILISVLATLCYFAMAGAIYLPLRLATGGSRRRVALFLFGRDLAEGRDTCVHIPVWLESTLQVVTRILTAPLAAALYLLLALFAFRRQREQMTAFLVSRVVLGGAGMVDDDGRLQLSDKAPAINCLLGYGGMLYDRPIYSMGHFFKDIYAESWFSPRNYFGLFAPRQRLQLAIGDSNMCQSAELLRVGTTALLLDACEAGALKGVPVLRQPIRALRAICADPSLTATVPVQGGKSMTALEMQWYYYHQCAEFLDQQPDPPAEALEIAQLWRETLISLDSVAGDTVCEDLVGVLDWATKQYLLEKAGGPGTWQERKKIDICYHELSSDGYYRLLADAGLATVWLSDEEIDRAIRTPPADSPAATRGRYIREFARTGTPISVNWKAIFLGRHWDTRVVRISDFGQPKNKGRVLRTRSTRRART